MPFFTSLFYFFLGGAARQAGGGYYKDWVKKRFSGSTKIFSDQGVFLTAHPLLGN